MGEKAIFSNPVRNPVLESCSYIIFTLEVIRYQISRHKFGILGKKLQSLPFVYHYEERKSVRNGQRNLWLVYGSIYVLSSFWKLQIIVVRRKRKQKYLLLCQILIITFIMDKFVVRSWLHTDRDNLRGFLDPSWLCFWWIYHDFSYGIYGQECTQARSWLYPDRNISRSFHQYFTVWAEFWLNKAHNNRLKTF